MSLPPLEHSRPFVSPPALPPALAPALRRRVSTRPLTHSRRGRLQRWGAAPEDIASLRFDMRADVAPLLNSYNTKQLFLYLTASYVDDVSGEAHEVVLWDRIITRGNLKDFRSTGDAVARKNRSPRPKVRMDDVKNKYTWRNPSRSFK